jgi:hypothetical protein
VTRSDLLLFADLTKTFAGRKTLGRNMNRRLVPWTKGATVHVPNDVSERSGSAFRLVNAVYWLVNAAYRLVNAAYRLVNAAYASQVVPSAPG